MSRRRSKISQWIEDEDEYFGLEDCSSSEEESEPEEESEEDLSFEKQLDDFLPWDEVDPFLDYLRTMNNSAEFLERGQEVLMRACQWGAYKCVSALLNGETPLIFDVNKPASCGLFPIHRAAVRRDAGMIELLLYHGAQADIRVPFICQDDSPYLPLHAVLHFGGFRFSEYGWEPAGSIYQLVAFICLPHWQRDLECVELLAWKAGNIDRDFLLYAMKGEHVYLAVLLAMARKKFAAAIPVVRKLLISDFTEKPTKDDKEKLSLLLDVFEKAGDALETYIRKKKRGFFIKEISDDVADLLRDSGFHVGPADTDLSRLRSSITSAYDWCSIDEIYMIEHKDVGMEHYGTSGHRWTFFNKQRNGCKVRFEEPNKPSARFEITEDQKCQIPTGVGKEIPVPIPCSIDYDFAAAEHIKAYKFEDAAPVEALEICS